MFTISFHEPQISFVYLIVAFSRFLFGLELCCTY